LDDENMNAYEAEKPKRKNRSKGACVKSRRAISTRFLWGE